MKNEKKTKSTNTVRTSPLEFERHLDIAQVTSFVQAHGMKQLGTHFTLEILDIAQFITKKAPKFFLNKDLLFVVFECFVFRNKMIEISVYELGQHFSRRHPKAFEAACKFWSRPRLDPLGADAANCRYLNSYATYDLDMI